MKSCSCVPSGCMPAQRLLNNHQLTQCRVSACPVQQGAGRHNVCARTSHAGERITEKPNLQGLLLVAYSLG
jgi:hypothetical protein